VPLVDSAGTSIGVIQLSTINIAQQFSSDDLDLLTSVAAQASLAIENATLHDTLLKQHDYERDMEFAAQVQQGFLPRQAPELPGYEFADHYEAAFSVGGDYFDYVPLSDGRLAIAVGDVAGKGVSAALLMARLHTSARYHLLSAPTPSIAMNHLNDEVAGSGLGFRFITLVVAVIDVRDHSICICNAGHLPPALRRAKGIVELVGIEKSGMPLGVLPNQEFSEVAVSMKPKDALLFYTDGITEAMDSENTLYGKQRLIDTISTCNSSTKAMVKTLVKSVETFCGTRSQRDDVCVAAVRRIS